MRKLLLVLSVVIALMFGLVLIFPCCGMVEARSDRAKLDMSNICGGVSLYRKKHHADPTSLRELVDTDVLEKLPKDPWGNDYVYALGPNGPELWSYGSDGVPAGDGSAADIHETCSKLQMRSTE